jgi:hypothetical protein
MNSKPQTALDAPTGDEPSSGPEVPPIVFVGGTGRSGTHIIARLVSNHPRFAMVPVEVRFHVEEERGFPALLDDRVSKDEFLKRLRGFWWRGFQTRRFRGMYRFVPQDRFDSAVAEFEDTYDAEPERACRRLFWELLWFRAERDSAAGLVEQSCDTVAQAPTLMRLFPEARFIHVVRDGRDASASRVAQAWKLIPPRTRRQGLEWWEDRLRRVDAGARRIPPDRLITVSLDELLLMFKMRGPVKPLAQFLGVHTRPRMRNYLRRRMSHEQANTERWRRGLSERRQRDIESQYGSILDGLEADGVNGAVLLRRTFERSRARRSGGEGPTPIAYLSGDGQLMEPKR